MSKTLRQFQCRDDLWARVDALAKRRGISTDDVVSAALLQLFKSKTKKEGESSAIIPAPAGLAAAPARPAASPAPAAAAPPAAARPAAAPPSGLPRPPGPPLPAARPAAAGPPASAAPPAAAATATMGLPGKAPSMAPRLPRPASAPAAAAVPVQPSGPPSGMAPAAPKAAPALPRPQAPSPAAAPTRLPPPAAKAAPQQVRPLYVMFENQWYEVDKEEYVIGRGQKFSDLPIKDANISRRHCSIVRRGPDYFIKDLGSTNGIEFEGTRVDNHKILEGSVYFLCDHQLRFSFTPPSSLA